MGPKVAAGSLALGCGFWNWGSHGSHGGVEEAGDERREAGGRWRAWVRADDVERKVPAGAWMGGLQVGVGEPFAPEQQTVGRHPRGSLGSHYPRHIMLAWFTYLFY